MDPVSTPPKIGPIKKGKSKKEEEQFCESKFLTAFKKIGPVGQRDEKSRLKFASSSKIAQSFWTCVGEGPGGPGGGGLKVIS